MNAQHNKKHSLWVERYRPKSLVDYVVADPVLAQQSASWIAAKDIPHLLFSGYAGAGKTTLANILIRNIVADEVDVLRINASERNNVQTIRDDIKSFSQTLPVGHLKIILLDEADMLTPDAQGILRGIMEEFSGAVRFILTCNYDHKIIPAIKSRCQHFAFKKPSKDDLIARSVEILDNENISFDLDVVDSIVTVSYPDIRKMVQLLQQFSIDGHLVLSEEARDVGDYKLELLELIASNNWREARKLVCSQVSGEEWTDVYRFLYDNLDKCSKFKDQELWDQGIVLVATYLYQHTISSDPEINMAALFIELGSLNNE